MTPEQQQPKEHCEHECVCGVLMVGGIEGDKSPCDITGCKHDTRSRPHPAPQAQKTKCCVSCKNIPCKPLNRVSCPHEVGITAMTENEYDEWMIKHDAAIERKAREEVLKPIRIRRETYFADTISKTPFEKSAINRLDEILKEVGEYNG